MLLSSTTILLSFCQLLISVPSSLYPHFPLIFVLSSYRTDARTVSSGSSAWEGQLTSLVLSEYASTEMSIHALYMHEVRVYLHSFKRWWRGCYSEYLPPTVSICFCPCSFTNSSPVASCLVIPGTGRRVTKAATASPMKSGANPILILEISPARTLFPPQFPVPVPFPPQLQPPALPPWARRGHHRTTAASGAIVDPPQVFIHVVVSLCFTLHAFEWKVI